MQAASRLMPEPERTAAAIRGLAAIVLAAFALASGQVRADDHQAEDVWEALTKGKPVLHVRGRIEVTKADGLNQSEAYTVRTRLGYGTKPFHGWRVFAEFENVAAATQDTYFDVANTPNVGMRTPIADPPTTEFNQGFIELNRPDWLGTRAIGGRQRIVFDDARFIGDVIWRQNQQTYDGGYLDTTLGLDGFKARYGYISQVHRIFGGVGNNPAAGDFDSRTHVFNVSFDRFEQAKIVAFAYFMDLRLRAAANQSANSNQSFGFRLTGGIDLTDALRLVYQGSYAHQSDYSRKMPDYNAHYGLGDVGISWNGIGTLGAGYESLGSDDGIQQFNTPLGTNHKFNGWADVFVVDNGGPNGLRNFYAYVAPKLPWKLRSRLVYHRFWADNGGAHLGDEFDALLGRGIGKHIDLLFKSGYFVAANGSPRPTTYRVTFDLVIKF